MELMRSSSMVKEVYLKVVDPDWSESKHLFRMEWTKASVTSYDGLRLLSLARLRQRTVEFVSTHSSLNNVHVSCVPVYEHHGHSIHCSRLYPLPLQIS